MSVNNVNNGVPKTPIDNQKLSQQQAQSKGNAAQSAAQQQASAAQAAPRQDSVSLTQSAQQLSQVQKKSAEAPVNQEKVDRLKKAIQNGEYKVNADVLADKIAKLEGQIFGVR